MFPEPVRGLCVPKYRVTTTIEAVRVVEADNPFQAAVQVGGNVTDVRPARGRTSGAVAPTKATGSAKVVKQVAKKRKPLSPEARAKLAQNLVKARAARAANQKAAKKATKAVAKKPTTRSAKKVGRPVKKR
jgi:hypothetical protein